MFKPIATTKSDIKKKIYVPGMAQWDIYPALFINNPTLKKKFKSLLLPIKETDPKCFKDVKQLCNLVTVWDAVLYSGIINLYRY